MKKRIITSALALALAFSLCACTDNTSTTESYSDSTSGTTASGKSSFEQSGDSVLLPESGYETSKPNQANCCLPRKTQKVGNHGISRNKAG